MWELLLLMIERLGIIVTVAFIMTRFRFVRHLIDQRELSRRHQISVIAMFGFFGIMGTYSGLTVDPEAFTLSRWTLSLAEGEAIANSRVIGIVVAGLLGGWKVGVAAGIIAGAHRYLLGGFTAFSCGLSTVIAGALAGYFYKKNLNRRIISLQTALLVGMLAELIQMLIILLLARPFDRSVELVANIGIPMIIANGIGTAIFILIIRNVVQEEERMGSTQAQKALRLADSTLEHMRKGLSRESAQATASILLKEIEADAVSITDKTQVLTYVGIDEEYYRKNDRIQTTSTKQVLKSGRQMIAGPQEIRDKGYNGPIRAAIITPLKVKGETIGSLKLYFVSEKKCSPTIIELSKGLSSLLSHQLELAEADRYLELANQAEIKALQAQVSPHFLFNALNTIISMIRTDPMQARKLLLSLSRYFRQNLAGTTQIMTTLEEELKHVRAYLDIESARFRDKLHVEYAIDPNALYVKVPTMTLQSLVENAIKHGVREQLNHEGQIIITMQKIDNKIKVSIEDNGIGIPEERLKMLTKEMIKSKKGTGIGLYNVNRRLKMTICEEAELNITSKEHQGTTISFTIPIEKGGLNHESNHKNLDYR